MSIVAAGITVIDFKFKPINMAPTKFNVANSIYHMLSYRVNTVELTQSTHHQNKLEECDGHFKVTCVIRNIEQI